MIPWTDLRTNVEKSWSLDDLSRPCNEEPEWVGSTRDGRCAITYLELHCINQLSTFVTLVPTSILIGRQALWTLVMISASYLIRTQRTSSLYKAVSQEPVLGLYQVCGCGLTYMLHFWHCSCSTVSSEMNPRSLRRQKMSWDILKGKMD